MARVDKYTQEIESDKEVRRLRIWQKIIIALIVIVMVAGGAVFGYLYTKMDQIKKVELDEAALSCVDMDGWVNILLLGVDSRDMDHVEGARTDCIIVCSIKEETSEVYLTSIYRDTFVKMGKDELYDKITHAFSYGGAEQTIRTVNQALDLNIQNYVLFNFKAVADVVDGLDGITVDVEDYEIEQLNFYTIETAENIGRSDYQLVEAPGTQRLDGCQAVSYGRIRKGVGDDFKRTERMRTVISLLIQEAKNASWSKLDNLIDVVLPQVETSLSNTDILLLAKDMGSYTIKGSVGFPYSITTGYINGVSYVLPTDLASDVKRLHEEVFGQKDYEPTALCYTISDQILYYVSTASAEAPDDAEEDEEELKPVEPQPAVTPDPAEGEGGEEGSGTGEGSGTDPGTGGSTDPGTGGGSTDPGAGGGSTDPGTGTGGGSPATP